MKNTTYEYLNSSSADPENILKVNPWIIVALPISGFVCFVGFLLLYFRHGIMINRLNRDQRLPMGDLSDTVAQNSPPISERNDNVLRHNAQEIAP